MWCANLAKRMEPFLDKTVSIHESQFGAEKLLKTVNCFLALAAIRSARVRGPTHEITIGLEQLAAKLGNARYTMRFHGGYCGMLVELVNLKNNVFNGGWRDPMNKFLIQLQFTSMMPYYVCEHLAFLGWTAPDLIGKRLTWLGGADELSRRSNYGFAVWCALELWRTIKRMTELDKMDRDFRRACSKASDTQEMVEAKRRGIEKIESVRYALRLNVVTTLGFMLPTIHYALPSNSRFAVQPPWLLQTFNMIECLVGYYTMWTGLSSSRPQLPDLIDKEDKQY